MKIDKKWINKYIGLIKGTPNLMDLEEHMDQLATACPKPLKAIKSRKQPLTKSEMKEKLKAKRLKLKEKKRSSPAQVIKRCDILFSQIIRARDKKCLRCSKTENLQCAHIFSRKNYATRWFPQNAITLCYACHIFWGHKNPVDFTRFVENILGKETLDGVQSLSHQVIKHEPQWYLDLEKMLHERLKDLTNMDD